jgi:hypothetical protein
MRYYEIVEGALKNGSFENALQKMIQGYRYGLSVNNDTCYAYVGAGLAKQNPVQATIRFWGLKRSGLIAHGDALLPNGKIISDIPFEKYAKYGYEIVKEISLDEFKELSQFS